MDNEDKTADPTVKVQQPTLVAKRSAVSRDTTKDELKELHRQKMAMKKAAIAHEYNTRAHRRRYRLSPNLSRNHPNKNMHPREAY